MIKQQILQIGSSESFFNNHTSLYQFSSINPFVSLYSGEFHINYQNRLTIKHLALGELNIKFGEDKFINIINVCMQKIVHPKTGLFGIRLSKNGTNLEIFGELDNWYEHMKKYTIQFDFIVKYQLYQKVGEGYSTITYRAKHKFTKNEYAVKVFDKKRLFTSNYDAKALLRELKILRLIDHDSLLKFHEIYESNNHIYIVQEFLKGEKLYDLIAKKRAFSEQEVIQFIKPLFQAVQYLHDNKIFHKQISTQSILLKYPMDLNRPCLIDFNKAETFMDSDNDEQKLQYSQPEKQIKYYVKVDVLSLGIVMHNLLTGQQYTMDKALDEAMMNKFQGQADLQFIDPPLTDLCFDFLTTIFNQGNKTRTCRQLLSHPIFSQDLQKSQKMIPIAFLGTVNTSQNRFRISSKHSSRSPQRVKVIPAKFNIMSKSPSEKPNLNNDYFEPPQSHLMFRRGSRQKRTLNFQNHQQISDDSMG